MCFFKDSQGCCRRGVCLTCLEKGWRQTAVEADWGLMGSTMAHGTSYFLQAPGPKGRMTVGTVSRTATAEWVRPLPLATDVLEGGGLWPLDLALCQLRGRLLRWSPSKLPIHAEASERNGPRDWAPVVVPPHAMASGLSDPHG